VRRIEPWWVYISLSVIVAAMTIFGLGVIEQRPSAVASQEQGSCSTAVSVFLTRRDLGAFTVMVNRTYTQPPWKGGGIGQAAPDFVTEYLQGRLMGYIANIALHGPDVPAEKAREHRIGYVGKWPLVPLEGPIVRDNRGLLEVYETVQSFKAWRAAATWVSTYRTYSGKPYPYSHWISAPQGARDSVAWAGTMGPPRPGTEHDVYYNARYGSTVLEMAFQGGASVNVQFVKPYWLKAAHRLVSVCRS